MASRLIKTMSKGWWGVILLGAWTCYGAEPSTAQEQSRKCTAEPVMLMAEAGAPSDPADGGKVEERAVPRMGPGGAPIAPLKGGFVEGNRLRAAPGYAIDLHADGTFMLRQATGGKGPTGRCNCTCCSGTCTIQREDNAQIKCVASGGCEGCSIIIDNPRLGGMKSIQ